MPDETPDPSEAPDVLSDDESGDAEDVPPEPVVDEAERLTRLARQAVDDAEREAYLDDRTDTLSDHDYIARVREDETRDVLVLHPDEWVTDGQVHPERIDDIDRGIEIPLSGPGEGDDWEAIDEHNREIVAAVREAYGDTHAENAAALADFMGNHYAKPLGDATGAELDEFLDDYYPRNAWPTAEQRAVVEKSVAAVFDVADEPCPLDR